MKFKNIIPIFFIFSGTLGVSQPSLAGEKIEVIPIIKSTRGLSGKKFNYLDGKPELRLLKVFSRLNYLENSLYCLINIMIG